MKTKNYLFLIAFSLLAVNVQSSKLWRVTKDASLFPNYGNLQNAIDSCGVGDTIYVYPGNYGTIEIKKQLTILGVGYFLTENAKDTITSFPSTSNVDNVTFSAGSDFSIISGMTVGVITCNNANNITISGNLYNGMSLVNSNYTTIKKNCGGQISGTNSSNTLISNNIMGGINFDDKSNIYFQNNFVAEYVTFLVYNSTLINNIILANPDYGLPVAVYNSSIQNNITIRIALSANNNNFQSTYNLIYPNSPLIADNYQLAANSVAKGKGLGGVDCGPFGGDDPYCLSGLNYIPTIAKLTMPVIVTGTNGLAVKVIVRSNR